MSERLTVIQRLQRLGFSVTNYDAEDLGSRGVSGGLLVRNDKWLSCLSCHERFVYYLLEPALIEAEANPGIAVFLADLLGRFCNGCGYFEREPKAMRSGYLGGQLPEKGDLFEIISRLETDARPLRELDDDELQVRENALERELHAIRLQRALRRSPYRG